MDLGRFSGRLVRQESTDRPRGPEPPIGTIWRILAHSPAISDGPARGLWPNSRPHGILVGMDQPADDLGVPLRASTPRGHLLVDRELRALLGTQLTAVDGAPIPAQQVQAASLDLRLGPLAIRVKAGFLPDATPLETRLADLELERLDLSAGARLERGAVYVVPLMERFALPADVTASFNPRSSAGRCDLFTRVLVPGNPRFNETPAGWRGQPWIEIAPLSFPVELRAGDRLCQVRLARGRPLLSDAELRAVYRETPLCFGPSGPLPYEQVRFDGEGGIELQLGLSGREPAGWRARAKTPTLEFAGDAVHDMAEFWEPVSAPGGGCILEPGGFYLFASRERVFVPPTLAAEMLPVDTGLGELRNNYAGFFDSGFGRAPDSDQGQGTTAVLEVRAHDVPFLVEDGQVFFRLRYYRASGRPDRVYAEGRSGRSYRHQDLTPARCFRPPTPRA